MLISAWLSFGVSTSTRSTSSARVTARQSSVASSQPHARAALSPSRRDTSATRTRRISGAAGHASPYTALSASE
jgi:hypothetical protein